MHRGTTCCAGMLIMLLASSAPSRSVSRPVDPPAAARHAIDITNFKFLPTPDSVSVGDTLVWTNHDILPHNITAGMRLNSGTIDAGKSWRHVVRRKEVVKYHCRFHPTMVGTLVVR